MFISQLFWYNLFCCFLGSQLEKQIWKLGKYDYKMTHNWES